MFVLSARLQQQINDLLSRVEVFICMPDRQVQGRELLLVFGVDFAAPCDQVSDSLRG